MQSVDLSRYHAAVFFMDNGQVTRQMRLSEFESILDGYLGLSDMADTDVRAVLVLMTRSLSIESLVFFRLYFDDEGRADGSWNIPIEALSLEGAKGPDLGDGPIRLVCRSQTPRSSVKSGLWDPDMSPDHNDFSVIRKTVQANALKFSIEKAAAQPAPEPEVPTLSPETDSPNAGRYTDAQRQKLARSIRAQRLRIRTLQSAYREEVKALNREHRLELQGLRSKMQERERQSERLKLATEKLKKKLLERNEEYLGLQDQLTATASQGSNTESLSAENVLLREQLERKDMELSRAQEALVQAEKALKAARRQAPDEDSVLARIRDGDAFLVAYRPGAGHITLPYDDIASYFHNPVAYVANQCGMSEPAYRLWLAHYESPVCQHKDADGNPCGEPVMRVSDPTEFKAGQSDRCEKHLEETPESA